MTAIVMKAKSSPVIANSVAAKGVDIIIGSDHAGFALKRSVSEFIVRAFPLLTLCDVGTENEDAVDYPDFGAKVAKAVSCGEVPCGILICGSGVGMSIVANKYPRVRAALCFDEESAILSRRHNDANVLVLAGRKTPPQQAQAIVVAWLQTGFDNDRHLTRLAKISAIECQLLGEK